MFKLVKNQLSRNFINLAENTFVFLTDVNKGEIWDCYIQSFPKEEQKINNCNACKSFLHNYGNLVFIKEDYTLQSIWDMELEGVEDYYKEVFKELDKLVTSKKVNSLFLTNRIALGTSQNYSMDRTLWHHLFIQMATSSKSYIFNDSHLSLSRKMGEAITSKSVLRRSLESISDEAVEQTLDLIESNNLYRGNEFKKLVNTFYSLKNKHKECPDELRHNFYWKNSTLSPFLSRIRNTAIGTLLINLSSDMDLEKAVKAFETVMAPSNYKRPNPIVTTTTLNKAKDTIEKLGLTSALDRRYAIMDDLELDNIIFTDRSYLEQGDIFDSLSKDIIENPLSFNKAENIQIEDFITNMLPKAMSLEVLLQESHINNFVSLITAEDCKAPGLFKWDNNFSWCYRGSTADSIKERVKRAGGKVEGLLRASLSWHNYDDLDISIIEPNGQLIYYANRRSIITKGSLDVDMNVRANTRSAVENIIYPYNANLLEGSYLIRVTNFKPRETIDIGFTVEIEFDGKTHTFHHDKRINEGQEVEVALVNYSKKSGFSIQEKIDLNLKSSKLNSKKIWGLGTNRFHKVNNLLLSPNYWSNKIGNKHFFFFLNECVRDQEESNVKPFFNEFLKEELLTDHKRIFEAISNKLKVKEPKGIPLHGLGFSSTLQNSFICKVSKDNKAKVFKVVID